MPADSQSHNRASGDPHLFSPRLSGKPHHIPYPPNSSHPFFRSTMSKPKTTTTLTSTMSPAVPAVISIPGTKRSSARRSASNPSAGISAFVVPERKAETLSTIKIALKQNGRVMGLTLNEHDASIVDLEFLQTPASTPIHVLGSCDRVGVVKLWFIYIAVDKLGVVVGPKLLRHYSFYTLRRSTTAFYWRIRLAGTVESGTMVLVPNDGTNVRVVTFHCEATQPTDGNVPLVGASEQTPALPAPSDSDTQGKDASVPQRSGVGLDDLATKSKTDASLAFEAAGHHISPEDSLREHGVSSRSTMNSSAAQVRLDGGSATGVDDMTKETEEAAALATGTPVTEMEGALSHSEPTDPFPYHEIQPQHAAPVYDQRAEEIEPMPTMQPANDVLQDSSALRPVEVQTTGGGHEEQLVVEGEGLGSSRPY